MKMLGLAASAMMATAIAAVPREAQAGTRFGVDVVVGYHDGGGYEGNGAYHAGYERGYREGLEHGDRDADHHRGFDFDHDKGYRCADAGYHGYFGPKDYYQAGFRRAYEIGYRKAYASRCDRDRYYGRRDDDHRDHDRWLDRGYEHRDRDDR